MLTFARSRFKIPHIFIFLTWIILFAALLTYLIPSGAYQREQRIVKGVSQTIVVPGTYYEIPKYYSVKGIIIGDDQKDHSTPTSVLGLITAIPKGLQQSGGLIFFIFVIGAVFMVIQESGTVEAYIHYLLHIFRSSPALLPVVLFVLMACATTFLSVGYEYIPLIPVLIIIFSRMGYDSLFVAGLVCIAQGVGWGAGVTSPLNTQVAQQVAEVPLGDGLLFRLQFFLVLLVGGILFLRSYAKRNKKETNPPMTLGTLDVRQENEASAVELTKKHILIGLVAAVLFATILYAVQTMGWGIIEMTGGFLAVGVCAIFISGMSGTTAMNAMVKGIEAMIVPALIVGVARAIQVILFEGQVVDTMLFHTADFLRQQHGLVATIGMFVFQGVLNFFIPSASGQALVTMPLLVPLSDILGLSRNVTVFAFIIGDGLSNLIIPTNGYLLAILGLAGIPFEKWFKFILPFFLFTVVAGVSFLILAYYTL